MVDFEKYAEAAIDLLEENYPGEWTEEEGIELAQGLIDMDMQKEAEYEKVAALVDQGETFACMFYDNLCDEIGKEAALEVVASIWSKGVDYAKKGYTWVKDTGGKGGMWVKDTAIKAGKGAKGYAEAPGKYVGMRLKDMAGKIVVDKNGATSPMRTRVSKALANAGHNVGKHSKKYLAGTVGVGAVGTGGIVYSRRKGDKK